MTSPAEHNTHPVLLTIATAAFIVLFLLGINLYTKGPSGHATTEHTPTATPKH